MLAKGIRASHLQGVIHRDLKPSNIMIDSSAGIEELKITDFGIATFTEEVFNEEAQSGDITRSTSGTVKGALPFMAPEMMFRQKGDQLTCALDIWSIGAMMFKLMTGEYPFGVFLNAAVNVKNQKRLDWPSFMTENAQFAPLCRELQKIVDSCLEYDPAKRLLLMTWLKCVKTYVIKHRSVTKQQYINSFRTVTVVLLKVRITMYSLAFIAFMVHRASLVEAKFRTPNSLVTLMPEHIQ